MKNKIKVFSALAGAILLAAVLSNCGGGGNPPPQPWPLPTLTPTFIPTPEPTAIPTVAPTAIPTATIHIATPTLIPMRIRTILTQMTSLRSYSEPAQPSYWYYCRDSQGYYPYVTSCPGGWTKVVPTPPGEEGGT